MTDIDQRLREAYNSVHLPEEVRFQTLAAIESVRVRTAAPSPRRRGRRLLAVAACLILALAGIGGLGAYRAYGTPAAYVDISVNPAIQLTVNPFGTVISAEGLNKDGDAVLATLDLSRCSYEAAIDELLANTAFLSYISTDSLIDVSISSDDEQLGAALAEQTDTRLAAAPCQHQCHRADGTTCGGAGQGHGYGAGGNHGLRFGSGSDSSSDSGSRRGHQHHGGHDA